MIQFRFERNGFDKKICKLPAANSTVDEKLLASGCTAAGCILHIYAIFTIINRHPKYFACMFLLL